MTGIWSARWKVPCFLLPEHTQANPEVLAANCSAWISLQADYSPELSWNKTDPGILKEGRAKEGRVGPVQGLKLS